MSRFWYVGMIIVAFAYLVGTGLYFYNDYSAYRRDENLISSLQRSMSNVPKANLKTSDGGNVIKPYDSNLLRKVDFASLQRVNPDIKRWLYVPNTALNAPVVDEPKVGQYFYAYRNYKRQRNMSGSFLVPKAPSKSDGSSVDDGHLLILGHRMDDYHGEWQFSNLPTRWGSKAGANQFPYLYVYYPDRVERWKVWMGLDVNAADRMYDIPLEIGSKDYGQMLEHIQHLARYKTDGVTADKDTHIMIWSTCNYAPRSSQTMRFALVSVPDVTYYYSTGRYVNMPDLHAENKWKKGFEVQRAEMLKKLEDSQDFKLESVTDSKDIYEK